MKTWNDYVRRVIIHSSSYLDFNGKYSVGGRQRYIRDLAKVIKNRWGREVVVVQKAQHNFETTCPDGISVIGLKSNLKAYGDPIFALKVSKIMKSSDGLLYASGEDAWPFFYDGAKAIQHGVWWDGPFSLFVRYIQKKRIMSCLKSIRSILCVDTNFINWLRCQGNEGLNLCQKCVYIPNYVDVSHITLSTRYPNKPLRLICARRFEKKRGILLFIEALGLLKRKDFHFSALVCTDQGTEEVLDKIVQYNLSEEVLITQESMDSIFKRYSEVDVAVVPTIWSEGTSLSCIEAICAGLPVVATHVGGLGNLIIPKFNGFLVTPSPIDIAQAIEKFFDFELWQSMRNNCLALRQSFDINEWREKVFDWLID